MVLSLCLPLTCSWRTSRGCVLSTSRPPSCTALRESPVVNTAWRCSSGAPLSCPTMTISFTEAAPVLYVQVCFLILIFAKDRWPSCTSQIFLFATLSQYKIICYLNVFIIIACRHTRFLIRWSSIFSFNCHHLENLLC